MISVAMEDAEHSVISVHACNVFFQPQGGGKILVIKYLTLLVIVTATSMLNNSIFISI